MPLSNYLAKQFASHVFGSGTYSKPSVLALALTSNVPVNTDTGSLSAGRELPNAGAYARQGLNPAAANWNDPPAGSGVTWNLSAITFPSASGNWGAISGVAICDSATYGGGNLLAFAALTTPQNITNGNAPSFASGTLQELFS